MRRRMGSPCGRPPPVDRDVRRARRLGAPYLAGFRPAGRPPLPAAAKEAKRRRGWAPMGVPAHSRSAPGPPFTGDTPIPSCNISGAQNTVTGMIPSGPLGPDAVQNFGLFHFTAAPGSDQPWQRVRVGGASDEAVPINRDGRPHVPPADSPPGNVSPPSRRGGACPSRCQVLLYFA